MQEMPEQQLEEIIVNYPSLESAARAGLIKALDGSSKVEFGGMIFRTPEGKFYISPIAEGGSTNVRMSARPRSKGDVLAGMFHSHPHDVEGIFSPRDMTEAVSRKVPTFVTLPAGKTRKMAKVFDPAVDLKKPKGRPFMNGMPMERQPLLPEQMQAMAQMGVMP